ncbi:MAG: hypothetical protein ACPL1H_09305 [bacterium]
MIIMPMCYVYEIDHIIFHTHTKTLSACIMLYKRNKNRGFGLISIYPIIYFILLFMPLSVSADREPQYAYQYSYAPLGTYQYRLYNITTYGTNQATGFEDQLGVYYGIINHINVGVYTAIPITQTGIGSQTGAELSFYTHTNIIDINSFFGYVWNSSGPSYVNTRLVMSRDLGRMNITVNAIGSHTYRSGSDPVDLTFAAGAAYSINKFVDVGLEALGEDLEAAFESNEAEGGAVFIVSPVLVFNTEKPGGLNLIVGPGYEIKNGVSGAVFRITFAKTF